MLLNPIQPGGLIGKPGDPICNLVWILGNILYLKIQ